MSQSPTWEIMVFWMFVGHLGFGDGSQEGSGVQMRLREFLQLGGVRFMLPFQIEAKG